MSTTPTLTVEIAFATDPFATPTWTDVTDYALAVSVRRGKGKVLDATPMGQCSVTLDNSDGRFDPNYTSGAYYPNVKPFRRVRVRAHVEVDSYEDLYYDTYTLSYGLFSGFITSWPQAYEWPQVSTVTVGASDGFQILNLRKLSGSYSQELSGTRVANILDDVSWPAGDRDIDAGQSTMQNVTLTDDNPLDHLQTVAKSENGLLFIDRDGNLRFRSRHGLISGTFDDAGHTFGDPDSVAGAVEIEELTVNYDDLDIWNDVRVSSQGVATQTATDSASQTAYLTRTLERTGLLLTSTTEQSDHAAYLLTGFKEPALRVDSVSHAVLMPQAEWQSVLDRDLGDKMRVVVDPPGGGSISQRSFVESVSWDIRSGPSGDVWRCSWGLTPASRRVDFWVLGDSIQGALGTGTRLAY